MKYLHLWSDTEWENGEKINIAGDVREWGGIASEEYDMTLTAVPPLVLRRWMGMCS